MREHALATVGVETPRGFRISKDRVNRKIDGVVALAMAAVAASQTFASDAAAGARVAAAMDRAQIEREFDQIRRAMPNVDWQLMSDDTLS